MRFNKSVGCCWWKTGCSTIPSKLYISRSDLFICPNRKPWQPRSSPQLQTRWSTRIVSWIFALQNVGSTQSNAEIYSLAWYDHVLYGTPLFHHKFKILRAHDCMLVVNFYNIDSWIVLRLKYRIKWTVVVNKTNTGDCCTESTQQSIGMLCCVEW